MAQLRMIFNAKTTNMPKLVVADGFRLRNILDSELDHYNVLRESVGFSTWSVEQFHNYRKKVLPRGMFLIEEIATGFFAASAGAETTDITEFPDLGVLGWVMTHPEMRGHHLGKSVSVACMHRLYQEGYRTFSLLSDDFRVAALKTYLDLGWKPWLYMKDMKERWEKVAEMLGRNFNLINCLSADTEFPPMEHCLC